MSTIHAYDFGGDPFPLHRSESRQPEAEPDPKKGTIEEEDSDLDDSKSYDLGGSD